jgi:hypothetical protein
MAEVVQVAQQPKDEGMFHALSFLKNPTFWYWTIAIVLIICLIVGLVFLIRWLISWFKARSNIFNQLRRQRIKLAKIHKRYPNSNHFLKIEKNTPIRLVKNIEGRPILTDPIAYYRGDYVGHEGNIILAMNMKENKKFFFFPITDLLIIPNKENTALSQKDGKGKLIRIDNLPLAKDIIKFNDNEILVYADSISNIGAKGNDFYVPVLTAKDGKIIDLSMPIYQSLKEVVIGDYLLDQSDEFVKVARKSIDMNPQLRYQVKSSDSSQSVEVPQNSPQ